MKKSVLLIMSLFLLSGCGGVVDSSTSSESTSSSSSSSVSSTVSITDSSKDESTSSSVSSSSSSEVKEFDKTSNYKFVDIDQTIYLFENETYSLDMMLAPGAGLSNVTYEYSSDIIKVENNKLIANCISDEQEIETSYLAISEGDYRQVLTVKVVNMNDYVIDGTYYGEIGSVRTLPSLGRLYGKNVVFMGDSITHNWSKWGHDMVVYQDYVLGNINDSYVKFLNEACSFNSYDNLGASGGTMSYIPSSADRLVSKSFTGIIHDHEKELENYDYYFVMYGTNDIESTSNPGKTTDEMVYGQEANSSLIGSMKCGIDMIRRINPDAQIYFINICYRTYGGQYDKVIQYNEAIETIASSYGCGFIDAYSNVVTKENKNETLSSDGLHLSTAGHRVLAKYILGE